jgi:hypothetical protein
MAGKEMLFWTMENGTKSPERIRRARPVAWQTQNEATEKPFWRVIDTHLVLPILKKNTTLTQMVVQRRTCSVPSIGTPDGDLNLVLAAIVSDGFGLHLSVLAT